MMRSERVRGDLDGCAFEGPPVFDKGRDREKAPPDVERVECRLEKRDEAVCNDDIVRGCACIPSERLLESRLLQIGIFCERGDVSDASLQCGDHFRRRTCRIDVCAEVQQIRCGDFKTLGDFAKLAAV